MLIKKKGGDLSAMITSYDSKAYVAVNAEDSDKRTCQVLLKS